MYVCPKDAILADVLDYLVGLITDTRMPEELCREITREADRALERIREVEDSAHA